MAAKDAPTPEDLGLAPEEVPPPGTDPGTQETPPPKEPAKRGRKPGQKNGEGATRTGKTAGKKAADLDSFAKQIAGLHVMAAMLLGAPEFAVSEPESQMLANALNNISEEYGLALDGKTGAAIQLLGTAAIIYGPRILAVRSRMYKEREQRKADEAQPVN